MLFNSIAGSGDIVSFDGISITTPPTKTTYTEGDTFDPTGMVVTMSFNNGALNKITNSYTVTPTAMTLEVTSVTISVTFGDETKTVTLAVTVNERHEIVYSGTHTTEEIVLGGDHYTQTSMTGSGILSVYGTWTDTEIWLCGGGADGLHGGNNGKSHGGGGGYVAQNTSTTLSPGTYTVTVGAAASASTITKDGTTFLTANGADGANGGSGGGAAGNNGNPGTGAGVSTKPFKDSRYEKIPCAGGGGAATNPGDQYANGGNGGSDGSDGGAWSGIGDQSSYGYAGKGGTTGGGRGYAYNINTSSSAATSATYYGSGGGGARYATPGTGYQGLAMLRTKKTMTPTAYRYYKLALPDTPRYISSGNRAGYDNEIADFALYTTDKSKVSYTGATYTASGTTKGAVANAFDGSTSTYWRHYLNGTAWIQVQLASAAIVSSFSVASNSTSYANDKLVLYGSNDGNNYVILYNSNSGLAKGWTGKTYKTFTIFE